MCYFGMSHLFTFHMVWSLSSFSSISEEEINTTGFLCQAEEGERGRENVFMTCNSEIGTSSAFWSQFWREGGNWFIFQRF